MMEEIITLIIHEAELREGRELATKLKEVAAEAGRTILNISEALVAIKKMEISEEAKQEVRDIVLTSHKP